MQLFNWLPIGKLTDLSSVYILFFAADILVLLGMLIILLIKKIVLCLFSSGFLLVEGLSWTFLFPLRTLLNSRKRLNIGSLQYSQWWTRWSLLLLFFAVLLIRLVPTILAAYLIQQIDLILQIIALIPKR